MSDGGIQLGLLLFAITEIFVGCLGFMSFLHAASIANIVIGTTILLIFIRTAK